MADDIEQQIKDAFATASADSLPGRMGIRILEASAQRVVGTMPVAGNTQPYGLLHGGRTLTTYEIVITDEQGRRVCTCRLTCLLRDVIPGDGHPFTGRV